MNRSQHFALLQAMKIDKKNLLKYQQIYKYAYLLSDGIFKVVFAEEKGHSMLISLLNAMLDLQGSEQIQSITLEMQEFPGVFNRKNCLLDIIGTTNAGEKVLVEIQQQGDKFFRDRVEYYMARVIENHVHKNEKYELPRIYFLGLLDFEMFPEEPQIYLHHVDQMCNGRKYFPKIQKIFVEIAKFFELEKNGITQNDNSDAAAWLRAIMSIIQEKPMPESILHNKIFKKLLESVKLINFIEDIFNLEVKNMTDLQAQHEIGYSEGHEQGFADGIEKGFSEGKEKGFADGIEKGFSEGKEKGFADGIEKGFAEGKEKGFADGIEKGFNEGKEKGSLEQARKIAKSLYEQGVPIEIISHSSGLSKEEILQL